MTVNPELCKTEKGVPILLASRWQEDDPRFDRIVVVTGYDVTKDKVQLNHRTWASRRRFGKAGGYKPAPVAK